MRTAVEREPAIQSEPFAAEPCRAQSAQFRHPARGLHNSAAGFPSVTTAASCFQHPVYPLSDGIRPTVQGNEFQIRGVNGEFVERNAHDTAERSRSYADFGHLLGRAMRGVRLDISTHRTRLYDGHDNHMRPHDARKDARLLDVWVSRPTRWPDREPPQRCSQMKRLQRLRGDRFRPLSRSWL